jgi:hypothetical protein
MTLANQLNEAIRAVVRDEMNRPPKKAVSEDLPWGSLAFLLILAIDVSAIMWELAEVSKHPVFKLVVQSLPALGGVGLVAAYKERLQAIVRLVASKLWFRVAVSFALVLIVYPIVKTYQVPLKLSDPKIDVFIDGKKVNTGPERAGVTHIPVSGLHEHELTVLGYGAEDQSRKDTYHLRVLDLLTTFRRSDAAAFEVGLLVPLTIEIDDPTIRLIIITGNFPELFLRGAPEPFEEIRPLPGGRHEVSIKARGGVDAQEVALPPGDFSVQYVGSHCRSKPGTVTLKNGTSSNTSLDAC